MFRDKHTFESGPKNRIRFFPRPLFLGISYLIITVFMMNIFQWGNFFWDDRSKLEIFNRMLLSGQMNAPWQYRVISSILVDWLANLLQMDIFTATIFWFFIFTFFSLVFFHVYLKHWFNDFLSFIGVLIFCLVYGSLCFRFFLLYDIVNFFLFVLGFWAILHNRLIFLGAVLFLSMLNKEIGLFLPLFYLAGNYKKIENKTLVRNFLIFSAIAVAVFFSLRLYFGFKSSAWSALGPPVSDHGMKLFLSKIEGTIFLLQGEIDKIMAIRILKDYYYLYLFFGLFLPLIFLNFKQRPLFLRNGLLWVTPLYVIMCYIFGMLREPRLFMPLLLILIPLFLFSLKEFLGAEKE